MRSFGVVKSALLGMVVLTSPGRGFAEPSVGANTAPPSPPAESVKSAFSSSGFSLSDSDVAAVMPDVNLALEARCLHGPTGNNSKAKFSAVEIAAKLSLNPAKDPSVVDRITSALKALPCCGPNWRGEGCSVRAPEDLAWEKYFSDTVNLTSDAKFLDLVQGRGFSPVKISWEDIGRYENSVWGDRISDVGIWVRKNEREPESAELALSVRRDSNFRDKILVVPAERIKIRRSADGQTRELSLPERLSELGLSSPSRDKNVIVSNQFAVVPVPSKTMWERSGREGAARAAFTFSIFPYGSTNYVITDVIEGSSDAIVGPGTHQLLFSNVAGQKAPFTASRAEERADLLQLESDLKSKGMDVDVQRYYLIQVPLKKNAPDIQLSNMGTPPFRMPAFPSYSEGNFGPVAAAGAAKDEAAMPAPAAKGLSKVAIGHGETEGPYNAGTGFRGQRADEPIRVTVVYFVTPVGEVTAADMEHFAEAFKAWDDKAIWGGSFVVKE